VGEEVMTFCDDRGPRRVSLLTGAESAAAGPCPSKAEANGACGGLPIEATVETPGLGPKDVVFAGGWGFHPEGRVHDCVADGARLAVVTGSDVEVLDTASGTTTVIDEKAGGERVAMGHGWVVWSDPENQIHRARHHAAADAGSPPRPRDGGAR
jgi:hypothetical protein